MKKILIFFLLSASFLMFFSCSSEDKDIDLDSVKLKYQFTRTDLHMLDAAKALEKDSTLTYKDMIKKYLEKDRSFFVDWMYSGDAKTYNQYISMDLGRFLDDKNTLVLFDSVLKVFPKDYDFKQHLTNPLKRLKHFFPKTNIPPIHTFVSGYPQNGAFSFDAEQLFMTDFSVGIGLHYYLGPEFSFYPPDIPMFIRRKCTPENIAPNMIRAFIIKKLPLLDKRNFPTFLDEILQRGIKHYATQKLCRETPPEIIINYTKEQYTWAEENEKQIFAKMIPILFSKQYTEYENFINPRPFSPAFGKDSPGMLGDFIAWRIIDKYMEENDDISLEKLVKTPVKDYGKIFKKSGYKP